MPKPRLRWTDSPGVAARPGHLRIIGRGLGSFQFGGVGFLLNGNTLVGVWKDSLSLPGRGQPGRCPERQVEGLASAGGEVRREAAYEVKGARAE